MSKERKVCEEILEIMRTYREQEASPSGVGTPGGLEHMGDVWRLFRAWEGMLTQEQTAEAAHPKGGGI